MPTVCSGTEEHIHLTVSLRILPSGSHADRGLNVLLRRSLPYVESPLKVTLQAPSICLLCSQEEVTWHGLPPSQRNWDSGLRSGIKTCQKSTMPSFLFQKYWILKQQSIYLGLYRRLIWRIKGNIHLSFLTVCQNHIYLTPIDMTQKFY